VVDVFVVETNTEVVVDEVLLVVSVLFVVLKVELVVVAVVEVVVVEVFMLTLREEEVFSEVLVVVF
jgi:hypothetical protein